MIKNVDAMAQHVHSKWLFTKQDISKVKETNLHIYNFYVQYFDWKVTIKSGMDIQISALFIISFAVNFLPHKFVECCFTVNAIFIIHSVSSSPIDLSNHHASRCHLQQLEMPMSIFYSFAVA